MNQPLSAWKRGNWLTTVSLLGVTVGFVVLVFAPQLKRIRAIGMEVQLLDQFISQEPAMAAQIEMARRELEETRAFVNHWKQAAPRGRKTAVLFGQIAQAARESQAEVVRFEPGPSDEGQSLRRMTLEMGCHGPFGDLFDCLKALESMPQSIWIEELVIERPSEDGQNLQCDLTLAIFADKSEDSD